SDVKHATMTTPYGVTRGTIHKQLLETNLIKSCKDPKKCARYLAKILEECITEVAVEAGNIMTWLRKVARVLAKANRGRAWTTPADFRIVHETGNRKHSESPHRIGPSLSVKWMKHGRSTRESKPMASSLTSSILLMGHTS